VNLGKLSSTALADGRLAFHKRRCRCRTHCDGAQRKPRRNLPVIFSNYKQCGRSQRKDRPPVNPVREENQRAGGLQIWIWPCAGATNIPLHNGIVPVPVVDFQQTVE